MQVITPTLPCIPQSCYLIEDLAWSWLLTAYQSSYISVLFFCSFFFNFLAILAVKWYIWNIIPSVAISSHMLPQLPVMLSYFWYILKLKFQYFGHLMWRADSLEKTPMLGRIEGRRRGGHRGWDGWMASPTQWTWVWANSGRWWRTRKPGVLEFMGSQSQTWLSN